MLVRDIFTIYIRLLSLIYCSGVFTLYSTQPVSVFHVTDLEEDLAIIRQRAGEKMAIIKQMLRQENQLGNINEIFNEINPLSCANPVEVQSSAGRGSGHNPLSAPCFPQGEGGAPTLPACLKGL